MQPSKCGLFAFGIFAIAGTAIAAETDISKCPVNKQWQDAFNKGDAAAIAALYTPDAIEVSPFSIRVGPAAVKQRVEDMLKQGWKNATIDTTKCDIESAFRFSSGTWTSDSPQGPMSGFWTGIEVKDGDSWKMQNLTWTLTPPPPPQKK